MRKNYIRSGCPSPTGSVTSSSRGTGTGSGTWSSSTLGRRGRERSAITSSTFKPPTSRNPSRPSSRTASASPGPYRKRNPSGGSLCRGNGSETEETLSYLSSSTATTTTKMANDFPTSTHSTPARKPGRPSNNNKSSVSGLYPSWYFSDVGDNQFYDCD